MQKLFFCFLLLQTSICFSQKKLDTKIIVKASDTVGLYEKIRLNFVNAGFIVKDNRNPDTLVTYLRDTRPIGYLVMCAAIKGNTVTYWGFIGRRQSNMLGYTIAPNNFEKIFYYKSGKAWQWLLGVANKLGSDLTYSK